MHANSMFSFNSIFTIGTVHSTLFSLLDRCGALVWRTRLMRELIAGFKITVLSIGGRISLRRIKGYPSLTRTRNEPGTGFSETTIMYPPPHPEYMAPG